MAIDGGATQTVGEAREHLGDAVPSTRDGAAAAIRRAIAADAGASGDPGEAAWKRKLAAFGRGVREAEFMRSTGATRLLGTLGNGGESAIYRLDDHWTVDASFDRAGKLASLGRLVRDPRTYSADPPPGYSGRWVTYSVDGQVHLDDQYLGGHPVRHCGYFDSGQLSLEQHYTDGTIDGVERAFFRDGRPSEEGQYRAGRRVGRWVHWKADGSVQAVEDVGGVDEARAQP
jgi:hypothetical protein